MRPISPRQREKTDVFPLTVFSTQLRLKGAVIEFTALNVKSTFGGKVNMQQPPTKSGFFVSALMANSTHLPRVARNKKPTQRGNNRGVTERTLYDSRQLVCQNVKHTFEVNAL